MTTVDLVAQVKANLLITFNDDDQLIGALINAATSYACSFQHLPENHYETHDMSGATRQGIVMLASHFYESRDGSTAGFWADKPDAAKAVWNAVNNLLRLDRDWKV
ncbi:phage DNA packaging protein [Mobiluncus holmesii ATCC 35242]|uniref:Phage DNA packaging protein n=1 Tax=Mobiluncus holmesii ATCC 35242 TaxID=887899 RepID=E6M3D6_9ACTO|nr:head-tail connector protein [Mobiluncus holmesii]EFU82472.1 phage DNA packaging protein [Mobiluncus holmesii ATCC 35242]STY88522.1 uncharacterized phage protein (possible DNA packaging) [Mobiluncus holmesii]